MTKKLLFLSLILFKTVLYAQEEDQVESYSEPYLIENPPKSHLWKSFSGSGYYYDLDGKKNVGKIEVYPTTWIGSSYSNAYINFKDSVDQWWTIFPEEIESVVIKNDSLVVADGFTFFKADGESKERLNVTYEFLKVLLVGKITIFEVTVCCRNYYTYSTSTHRPKLPMKYTLYSRNGESVKSLNITGSNAVANNALFIDYKKVLQIIEDNKSLSDKWKSQSRNVIRKNYLKIIKAYNSEITN